MAAARDEAAIALVGLAHVEQLDLSGRKPSLELVDRHRLHLLGAAGLHPALELEDADRMEPLRRELRLALVGCMEDERDVGQHERGLGAERRAGNGHVHGSGRMPRRERVRIANVEHLCL